MQTKYYSFRSAIVGIFTVLSITLIIFLLVIAKKGLRMATTVVGNVVIPLNPDVVTPVVTPNPTVPTTTNDLPPQDLIALSITSGTYDLTSPSRNLFLQATPLNGVINVLLNPLAGSKGRSITISNARLAPANGNIVVLGKGGVQIDTSVSDIIGPGNKLQLLAIRDNVYIVK